MRRLFPDFSDFFLQLWSEVGDTRYLIKEQHCLCVSDFHVIRSCAGVQSGFDCVRGCRERRAETQHWSLISLPFLSDSSSAPTSSWSFSLHTLVSGNVSGVSSVKAFSCYRLHLCFGQIAFKCNKFVKVIPTFLLRNHTGSVFRLKLFIDDTVIYCVFVFAVITFFQSKFQFWVLTF